MTPERAAKLEEMAESGRRELAARGLTRAVVKFSTGTFWTDEQLAEMDACCVSDTVGSHSRTAIYLTRWQCQAMNARCSTHGHDNPEPTAPRGTARLVCEDWQIAEEEWVWR